MVPIPSGTRHEQRGHYVITRSDLYGTTPSGKPRVKVTCTRCTYGETFVPDDDVAIAESFAVHERDRHTPGLF